MRFASAQPPVADELVQEIDVRIRLAAEGKDLAEPVALDLGLGFPLWLYPVGSPPGENPPFGAVPQYSEAAGRVLAGESAVFKFHAVAPNAQDILGTTRSLLSGVKIGDIRRVGFRYGSGEWVLADYQVLINGRPFASAEAGKSPARIRVEIAAALTEVDAQRRVLERERDELIDLERAGLASTADLDRRRTVAELIASLTHQTLPYAEQIPIIEKFEFPPVVNIPPGDLTIGYRVKNAENFYVDLWQSFYCSEIVPNPAPLPQGVLTARIDVRKPGTPSEIQAIAGNALGFFQEKYELKIKQFSDINADLAIDEAKTVLVPGVARGAKVQLSPGVMIKNLGPQPIPQELLAEIKVLTVYEVESLPPAGKPYVPYATRQVICTNTLAQATGSPSGPWFLIPTCLEIPQGAFTTWTRLHGAKVQIHLPLKNQVISEGDITVAVPKPLFPQDKPENNQVWQKFNPCKVLGSGVGPYEVVAYLDPGFKSLAAEWESPPGELQRVVWPLPSGLNDQISSIEVGSEVKVWLFEHDFWGTMLPITVSTANLGAMDNRISSLLITDNKVNEPWGVYLTSEGSPSVTKLFPFCLTGGWPFPATVDGGETERRSSCLAPSTTAPTTRSVRLRVTLPR